MPCSELVKDSTSSEMGFRSTASALSGAIKRDPELRCYSILFLGMISFPAPIGSSIGQSDLLCKLRWKMSRLDPDFLGVGLQLKAKPPASY